MADFHEHSFQEAIKPLVIADMPALESGIAVKLNTKGKNAAELGRILSTIEREWKAIYPKEDFRYSFLDDDIAMLYKRDRDAARLMNTAMIITLFISCIGLFGLSMFAAERRTKEISIRKIMGATVSNIAVLLTKDFIVLVLVAFVIASPVAWLCFTKWLQEFTYRIAIGWWVFALAGFGAVLVALITVSFHAIKAAVVNPAKTLRTE